MKMKDVEIVKKLSVAMKSKKITVYALSKMTGIKYELLRRVFAGKRKLTADELVLIVKRLSIDFDEIK